MNIFTQFVRAILGALIVIGLHALVMWHLVSNEPKSMPVVAPPKAIQVSLIAPKPPAEVKQIKTVTARSTPALPIRPKPAKPRAKPRPKPKPRVKPKSRPKPKAKPQPRVKPQPKVQQPASKPVRTASSEHKVTALNNKPSGNRSPTQTAIKPNSSSNDSSGSSRSTAPVVTQPTFNAAYLNNPPPNYPRVSKRRGEEGKVLLKVQVSAQGKPIKIQLHRSSGFKRLDKAAQQTVKRWRFVPAKRGNTPIVASVIVPIAFNLR